MTKDSPITELTTCLDVIRVRSFRKHPGSNCYEHISGNYHCYLFGEQGPTQEWRVHKKQGTSFITAGRGIGPADLQRWLQENLT